MEAGLPDLADVLPSEHFSLTQASSLVEKVCGSGNHSFHEAFLAMFTDRMQPYSCLDPHL